MKRTIVALLCASMVLTGLQPGDGTGAQDREEVAVQEETNQGTANPVTTDTEEGLEGRQPRTPIQDCRTGSEHRRYSGNRSFGTGSGLPVANAGNQSRRDFWRDVQVPQIPHRVLTQSPTGIHRGIRPARMHRRRKTQDCGRRRSRLQAEGGIDPLPGACADLRLDQGGQKTEKKKEPPDRANEWKA